jgi:hypothetical protein
MSFRGKVKEFLRAFQTFYQFVKFWGVGVATGNRQAPGGL